jgi:DNA polymerase-4
MESEERKIIHVDMDAFFASVEQRDDPSLRGKPVAVGGNRDRGVVAAASYEARKYGVRSAMPSKTAHRLCPQIIFVKHRFDVYKSVSKQIREIFYQYTDLVEPLSLDEAFLDVTHNKPGLPSATLIAEEIRQKIKQETQLTASAGVSVNKFLAKVASDIHKPDGLTLIPPDKVEEFILQLPIERFFGIGKVTAAKMKAMGINTGEDLQRFSRPELVKQFGKAGGYYHNICRGIDNRDVKADRITKSVSAENTFDIDLENLEDMLRAIEKICESVVKRLQNAKLKGRTVTLKIRDQEFKMVTRSHSLEDFVSSFDEIYAVASDLMANNVPDLPVRLLGVGVNNLNNAQRPKYGQLTLDF